MSINNHNINVLAFPAFKNKKINPYNFLLYNGLINKNVNVSEFSIKNALMLNFEILHIHWPEFYLNSNYIIKAIYNTFLMMFVIFYVKIFNKKIVWTVHNLTPHEKRYKILSKIYWWFFLNNLDGVISLSEANNKILLETKMIKKNVRKTVVYHGLYKGFYPNNISRASARKILDIDEKRKAVLFIGLIREYKNIENLIDIFKVEKLENKLLIIAGKFEKKSYYEEIKKKTSNMKNVKIFNKFIDDDDLQIYLNASDCVVLPFKNIFNSGSALLSVSFNKKVLVPYSENFNEYSKMVNGNIVTYNGSLTENVILDFVNKDMEIIPIVDSVSSEKKLNWNFIQDELVLFYKSLI